MGGVQQALRRSETRPGPTWAPPTPTPKNTMHSPSVLIRGLGASIVIAAFGLPVSMADDAQPRGTLSTDRDLVRAGSHSLLSWEIELPSNQVQDVIDIDPDGTITPKKDLTMRVRTLGVAFQSGSKLCPIKAYWTINGSSWASFFYGKAPDVDPTRVLLQRDVKTGDRIDFGSRGWSNRWLPFHYTGKTDMYVTVLKDGDTPPDYAPAYDQGDIVSFLQPYLDKSGLIQIGPRDVIILWENSTSAPGSRYFDMQDLVVLVTFE